LKYNIKK